MPYDLGTMTYPLRIGNIVRQLPIIQVSPTRRIPLIELLGDFELTNALADELIKLIPAETELIFTVETSGVALGHAVAERMNLPYKVARKHRHIYMQNPLIQEVESLTLGVHDTLWLDSRHAEAVKGKKTIILVDVAVSGSTHASLARLVDRAGGKILGFFAGFVQGNPATPVVSVGQLPVEIEDE